MSEQRLREWVLAWSSVYPTESDDAILHFDGRAALSMQEIDTILHWKLETQANYLAVARRNLASQPPEFVLDHVARAVRNPDDQAAFLLLANIKGFQIAIASSILMATQPDRYTVYDVRAKKSLVALGELHLNPAKGEWLNYLHSCRSIARRTLLDLRTVDRALFSAKGQLGLPKSFIEPEPHWLGALP